MRKRERFRVGFAVRMWVEVEVPAANLAQAIERAYGMDVNDVLRKVNCKNTSIVDANVDLASAHDMAALDKVQQ